MDINQIKYEAKMRVQNNRFTLLKPQFIVWILSAAISTIFSMITIGQLGLDTLANYEANEIAHMIQSAATTNIGSITLALLVTPLNYGVNNYFDEFDKNGFADINIIFKSYKYIIKFFVITIFTNFLISLGSAFLFIPGVILACTFSIIPYTYAKHPELGVMEMILRAWNMMKGHKFEYMVLELSFFGWLFLSLCTCGIGLLWVMPYYKMTMVKYFNKIEEAYNQIPYTTIYE